MVVQSFSPENRWYSDFVDFADALHVKTETNRLGHVGVRGGVELFIGWASGDQKFRQDLSVGLKNPAGIR